MLNTILGIVGWIGTLLVFAGVAIRLFRPEWDQYAYWAAIGRAGLRAALHAEPVARDRAVVPEARDEARRDDEHQRHRRARDSGRRQLSGEPPRQAVGSHGRRSFTLSDQTVEGAGQPEGAGEGARLRSARRSSSASATRSRSYEYASQNIQVEYIDADRAAGAREGIRRR